MNPDQSRIAPACGAAVVDERAIDGAGIGCWAIDVATDISRYSPKWAAQLGYAQEDFRQVRGNWRLITHREDLPRVAAAVDAVIAGRSRLIDEEFRVRRRDGSWQWVRSFGQVSHRDDDGRPLTLSGIHADIGARVQAARALEHREQRLRLVLSAGDEGWWDWNLATGRFEFGDYWSGLLGRSLATLQPVIDTWLDRVHCDDIAALRQALDEHRHERSALLDIEHRIVGADGRSHWLMARGRIVERDEDSGQPLRMAGVLVDISERKRANLALARSTALVQAVQSLQQRFIAQPDLRQLGHELLKTLLDFGEAEYGFIGEVLHDPQGAPYLKTFTLTNIAWNDEMQALYEAHHREGLEFRNLDTLFGHTLRTGELVIANHPAEHTAARGLPKGHPALNTYAGVPIHDGQQLIGMVGLGNRVAGFDDSVLELIRPLTSTIAVMIKAVRSERERMARSDELLRVSRQAIAAEARLRDITDGLPAVVFQFSFGASRQAHFSFVSRAIQRIAGTGPDLITSNPKLFLRRVLREDRRKVLFALGRCRASTETMHLGFRLRDADGTPRWLDATISRGSGSSAHPVWNGFLFDVSERKRTERELRQARDTADAANRAKSNFIATVSHEIRTPLHGVLGLIELMKLSPLETQQADNLRLVESSGKSLLRLIDDLLDFSSMERGQLEIRNEATALREEVTRTANFWAEAARAKQLPLLLDIADAVPQMVSVDALRLRQILDNLLSNAIKFTSTGSIRLYLGVRPASPRDGQRQNLLALEFTVSDTGIGIPAEAQARLFRPFVQADQTTARQFGGSGLGLSIARGLAERMGGTLSLDSQPGQGTAMHLRLSLRSLDEPAAATVDAGQPAAQTPATRLPTVLVAEDHVVNRILIRQQLAHLGYPALLAENGREALALWRQGGCALLLTDCHMPDMNGFELSRAIRAEEQRDGLKPMPIIACTADVYAGVVETCLAAGMSGWIGKPVSLQALRRKLSKWLGQRAPLAGNAPQQASDVAAPTPLLDSTALSKITGGDTALAADMLAAFVGSLEDERATLRRDLDGGNSEALCRSLHRLLGACRSACVPRLTKAVDGLQALARADDRHALEQAWPGLVTLIDDTAGAIAAQTLPTPVQHHHGNSPMNATDCHILVVDDHALQRSLLVRMLTSLSVNTVLEAADGEAALAMIAANSPHIDLVITDLDMPGMDGMELARGIAELSSPPPVALVSALGAQILASVGTLSRSSSRSLLSILPKPISIDALRDAIARVGLDRPATAVSAAYTVEEIAAGFEAGQFLPYYEPQVDLYSGDVAGFEALVRWHHPRDGVVPPGRFLDQVEASPVLIETLTRTVLLQALDQMRLWQASGYEGSLSVNLSPLSLTALNFASQINTAVLARGLDPRRITFELTESAAATGSAAIENITRLRIKGFRLSIDDFGTGYSSLQQLSELPLSELKIDRCFTSRMLDDKVARAAVESSLQLAQRLSLRSCGEGIESGEIVRQLRWLGCELGQGYLFTKPIPPERVLPWLSDWATRRGELIEEWRQH